MMDLAQQLALLADRLRVKNVTVYKKFGTAMIRHRSTVIEVVGARKESYRGESRNPEVSSADLLTDLGGNLVPTYFYCILRHSWPPCMESQSHQ